MIATVSRFSGVLILAALAIVMCACQPDKMRSDLNNWAKKNSLRNGNIQGSTQTKLDENGCPEGTVPGAVDENGKAAWCKSIAGGLRTEDRYPSGQIKSETTQIGNSLRITQYFEDGRPSKLMSYSNSDREGPWLEWYRNGQPKIESQYKSGKKHGAYAEKTEQGQLKIQGTYLNGLKHGIWTEYGNSATLRSRTTYVNDLKHGNAEFYDMNGKLSEHGGFYGDEKHGNWLSYHPTGVRKQQGTYNLGAKHGVWRDFDGNGIVSARSYFKNGQSVQKPRLAANVKIENADTLGARPPRDNPGNPAFRNKRPTDRNSKRSGWTSM